MTALTVLNIFLFSLKVIVQKHLGKLALSYRPTFRPVLSFF